jgi:hypothetical protein
MPVILSCSLSLYRADVFFAMPTKPVAKKPIPGKPHAAKPAQKNVVQKKPAPDKVENLAKEYLAELKEVDVTFEKEQSSSRNIASNIRNSPATYERSFLESAA